MASIWAELKRRNVVRVAVAYAVVGWLLIEISSTIFPIVQLPSWTITFVTMLLLLGFPLALFLSWVYELTPEGIERTEAVPAPDRISHATGRKLDYMIIALLLLAVGFVIGDSYVLENASSPEVAADSLVETVPSVGAEDVNDVLPNSVAVLPFASLSLDPENAFFAAGIHDELLNQLTKITELTVIGRTSVLKYAETDKAIAEIAEELNVETIMEGTIRYGTNRIRLTAQLIDPSTGAHLWSNTYDSEFDVTNVFEIESDIATSIALALEAKLSPAEQNSIAESQTESTEAWAYYLRANNALDELGNMAAMGYLDQAIEIDPNFAVALASRANLRARTIVNTSTGTAVSSVGRREAEQLALDDAARALALDSNLGQAYMARARVDVWAWRWTEAHANLERALQASPNDPVVMREFALLESVIGDPAGQAVRQGQRAVLLDPGNWAPHWYLALSLLYTGREVEALPAFREAARVDPTAIARMAWFGAVEAQFGNPTEGERLIRLHEQLLLEDSDVGPAIAPRRAYVFSQLGLRDDAIRAFDEFEAWAEEHPVGAGDWAMSYLAIGDEARALQWLNTAADKVEANEVDEGFWCLSFLGANIFSDPVLEQPEFVELRSRLGFRE